MLFYFISIYNNKIYHYIQPFHEVHYAGQINEVEGQFYGNSAATEAAGIFLKDLRLRASASTIFAGTNLQNIVNSYSNAGIYWITDYGFVGTYTQPANFAYNIIHSVQGREITLKGCAITINEQATVLSIYCLRSDSAAKLLINEPCIITANGLNEGSEIIILGTEGGLIELNSSYTLSGRGRMHAWVGPGGKIARNPVALPTLSGSYTGIRYQVSALGTILTRNGGVNYFAGTVAGTTNQLGVYN